ncbi:MAG TPA: M15 family metallopeptidase [Actinomycetota bacterium]|nr:M15 family metallopeptidase [Actinomycetota bacterium]
MCPAGRAVVFLVVVALAGIGCSPARPRQSLPAPPPSAPAPPSPSASHLPSPPASPTPPAAFSATVSQEDASDLGATWHAGCPVAPDQLSGITLTYWGFDNQPHEGRIVVATSVVPAVETVFRTLYGERFPIRSMRPVSDYGGSDPASTAADNTAGFNCRDAVAAGPPTWSEHAYGLAIDVNTVENPYLEGGQVQPPNATAYVNRSDVRPGMAVPGGELVRAFASIGWGWGGNWAGTPDYQHFSSTGH